MKIIKILIAINFSPNNCDGIQGIKYYSSVLKKQGIQVFGIGLGGKIITGEIEALGTTSKHDHYIFIRESYFEIKAILEAIYIIITEGKFDVYVPDSEINEPPSTYKFYLIFTYIEELLELKLNIWLKFY